LSGLESNKTSCRLFGWGVSLGEAPKETAVAVYDSTFCDSNFPQVFCSTFLSRSEEACNAREGAPITCGDEKRIDGFLLTDEVCTINGVQFVLNYHSVREFIDWIKEKSGAKEYSGAQEFFSKVSVYIFVSTLLVILKFF
jgi:hypothetical protein